MRAVRKLISRCSFLSSTEMPSTTLLSGENSHVFAAFVAVFGEETTSRYAWAIGHRLAIWIRSGDGDRRRHHFTTEGQAVALSLVLWLLMTPAPSRAPPTRVAGPRWARVRREHAQRRADKR